jgi:hypothetical protein
MAAMLLKIDKNRTALVRGARPDDRQFENCPAKDRRVSCDGVAQTAIE